MMSSIASAMTSVLAGVAAMAPVAVNTAPRATATNALYKRMAVSLVVVALVRRDRPVVVVVIAG
jgi:hypothetical protein